MVRENYPANWDELRRDVLERHLHRCVNCHTIGGPEDLNIHHIVPVGQAGSHRPTNLVPLCPDCHAAAHREQMAPRIRWYTNGELSNEEFCRHKQLWKRMRDRFGVPRYDPAEQCVYVPIADTSRIVEAMPT
jgi:5-methylcytosine-specific restriction endonuclease McrA